MSRKRAIRELLILFSLALLVLGLGACAVQARPSAGSGAASTAQVEPSPSASTPTSAPEAGRTDVESASAVPAQLAVPANLTQSAEAGAVTVEVTPLNLQDAQADTLDFAITMNTHSVDLGVDLAQMAVLQVGGAEIAAVRWQAPAGGGHHVQGTLSFPATDSANKRILEGATSITLVIRGLAGVEERAFTWDLTAIMGARPSASKAGSIRRMVATGSQGMMATPPSMPVAGMMPMTATMPMTSHGMMNMQSMMQSMMGHMPGMPMQSMEAGHMAPIPSAGVPDATEKTGAQPLTFREEDGIKVFELTARPVRWPILEGVKVTAWTYNGTVPGPLIQVTEGDRVRVILKKVTRADEHPLARHPGAQRHGWRTSLHPASH